MKRETDRRTFIKGSLLTPAAMALAMQARAEEGAGETPAAGDAQSMPQGRIGKLAVSRLLLGGNLLTHYTHSRDLKYVYNLAAHYNTPEKILDTLARAEEHGVNTLVVHTVPKTLNILKKHRERGGKMQWIICTTAPVEPGMEAYRKSVEELVNDGTEAIYLWGVHGDRLVKDKQVDLMAEAVAVAKECGVPSGVGAHDLNVVIECEKGNVNPDFYVKTLHHHNYPSGPKPEELKGPYNEFPGYWCCDPEETVKVMSAVEKPWIAFKVMAAGAIAPKDAFAYAFKSGADHVLAGMFDFEIAEDVAIARNILPGLERPRLWYS